MLKSILLTVRSALGIEADYDGFDADILIGINTAIFELNQMGVGPDAGFTVLGQDETWDDLFNSVGNLEAVKQYVILSVRMVFDPPGTSFLINAIDKKLEELGWRLREQVDPPLV